MLQVGSMVVVMGQVRMVGVGDQGQMAKALVYLAWDPTVEGLNSQGSLLLGPPA